jgi:ParB/RepB/Spo0J family partition protein
MATTTAVGAGVQMIALDRIRHDSNVRDVAGEDVAALAGSIALLGQITPVIVRPDGDGYLLVAGHKRYAALRELGHSEIRAEIHSHEAEHSERAAENIVRTQLDPYQEAQAVAAMLTGGLSEDGAAQALGWPKARVTARMRLLELPEAAQLMVGAGQIALSSVEQLRAIGQVSPELLDALIAYLADGNEWAAERLAREPGWVLDAALRQTSSSKVFAAQLGQVDGHELAALRLGKKIEALYERAVELTCQLDRYSYGATVRFSDAEVDQARAAGVVIEFGRGYPLIVDRALYRELVKQAIARTVDELEVKVAERAAEKKANRGRSADEPADRVADGRREEQRQLRELSERAHGVNLDLGAGLLTGLAAVDPSDMNVARVFVYGLLGADYDSSPYTQTGERVLRLAVSGIRLVIDEFRTDVTKTRKDGSRGTLRIDYGDPKEPDAAVKWLWKFVDGARSAGELYGRGLVVIAAEQYASRLVVPASQRSHPTCWSSHKDHAAKALRKLAGPHLPASLAELERAVKRAHRDCETAERAAVDAGARERAKAGAAAAPDVDDDQAVEADETEVSEDLDAEEDLEAGLDA